MQFFIDKSKIDIYNVKAVRDYSTATAITADGETVSIDSATTNAVYYELENGIFICVRPSGTEPKLKIYYFIRANDRLSAEHAVEKLVEAFAKMLEEVTKIDCSVYYLPQKRYLCVSVMDW